MSSVHTLLDRILSHLTRLQQPVVGLLQEGLDHQDIENSVALLPMSLPEEVYRLYEWRNGTRRHERRPMKHLYFFPGFYFLSLDEAVTSYQLFANDSRWNSSWFPLFANGGGDFYAAVGTAERQQSSEIIGFMLDLPDDEQVAEYESLEKMLLTMATCYDEEVFYVQSDGYLDADDRRRSQIAKRLNPNIPLYMD